jgi:hypothetical protein
MKKFTLNRKGASMLLGNYTTKLIALEINDLLSGTSMETVSFRNMFWFILNNTKPGLYML